MNPTEVGLSPLGGGITSLLLLEGVGSSVEEVQSSEERVLPAANGIFLEYEPRLALGVWKAAGDWNHPVMPVKGSLPLRPPVCSLTEKQLREGKCSLQESRPQHHGAGRRQVSLEVSDPGV